MTRISTSVSIDPEHKEAIEHSDYGVSEFVQHAVEHGLIDGDMYSLVETLSEKEQEQFEAFADELLSDAEDLRDDAEQHRQKADDLERRADELEARADKFTDLLETTSESVKTEIDEKRDDWKDAPDAEQTVAEAIDQLRDRDGAVEAEVLEDGPNHARIEHAAEKAQVEPAKLASHAIDTIDADDVETKLNLTSYPPKRDDWPPKWYVEPDAR